MKNYEMNLEYLLRELNFRFTKDLEKDRKIITQVVDKYLDTEGALLERNLFAALEPYSRYKGPESSWNELQLIYGRYPTPSKRIKRVNLDEALALLGEQMSEITFYDKEGREKLIGRAKIYEGCSTFRAEGNKFYFKTKKGLRQYLYPKIRKFVWYDFSEFRSPFIED